MSARARKVVDSRQPIADEVLAASGVMPDAVRHMEYLMRLPAEALRARLARLVGEVSRPDRERTWMERAVRKARAVL